MGPIKYKIMSGIDNKNLLIINFCASFTTQPPVKRLMEIKCIQNIVRKFLSENKSVISSIPIYRLKLAIKSYEFKYDLYSKNTYAPLKIKNGNIEATKYLHRLDVGKKIKINQKGRTPKFTQ